jgi:HD-like signal output (HDOD) protein/CheY-like chemotaxis protein
MASGFRALIVDDDVSMQRLGSHALRQHGFQCVAACDVREAKERLADNHFDVVVTDLRLPQKNGYSLVLELLQAPDRPIIVVCTDVIDARLTKDLLMRGVDDIFAKPVHGAFFAGKIRALLDVRLTLKTARPVAVRESAIVAEPADDESGAPQLPICLNQLNRKLALLSDVLPVSDAALDVATMTRSCEYSVSQIAAAIQRDAALTATVLRLANSPLYNHACRQILHLDQAVLMIGQQRLGELSLASSAMAGVTSERLPWLDLQTTWRRSMAAGIVMELLITAGSHQAVESGLCLSAIMHPLGRVVLGMLFPAEYQEMIEVSADTGESLDEQERRALPTTHSQVLAHLLAGWQIGPDVFLPLKFAFDEFSSLLRLSEPIRTKAELLKTSILLSRLAVGGWHDWDLLEIPAVDTLKRLRIADPIGVIERAKIDVQKLAAFSPNADATAKPGPAPVALQRVGYCNLGSAPHDLLATLLPSLGLEAVAVNPAEMEHGATAIVNALGAPSRRISKLDAGPGAVLVTSADRLDTMSRFAEAVAIPTSFGKVRECIAGAMSRKEARTSVPSTSWLEKFTSGKSVWRSAAKANSP